MPTEKDKRKAYLPVEIIIDGEFSNHLFSGEMLVKIRDSEGRVFEGLFQKCWMRDKDKLKVEVLAEEGDLTKLIIPRRREYGLFRNCLDFCYGVTINVITINKGEIVYLEPES